MWWFSQQTHARESSPGAAYASFRHCSRADLSSYEGKEEMGNRANWCQEEERLKQWREKNVSKGENKPWQMWKREWGCAEGVYVLTGSIGLPHCLFLLLFLIPTSVNVKDASECCKWVTNSNCALSTRLVGWLTQKRQEASSWKKRNERNQLNSSSPIKGNFSNPVNETQTSLSLKHSSANDLSLKAGAFQGF